MPDINSASPNRPTTHLEGKNVDDLGMENVLRLQLKFASLLSIAEQQGSFIGKGRTKVNGNDFGKIEKNLTIFQNTSDDVLKQNGQDLKLVMSNKASDFSNNSNTGISVNFNDEINTWQESLSQVWIRPCLGEHCLPQNNLDVPNI